MLCYLMAWRTLRSHFSKKLSLWTGFWSNIIIMRFKCYKLSSLITVFRRYSYLDFSQRYDNGDDPHSIYQDYPPYPDPFVSTFRSFSNGFDVSKVMNQSFLGWINWKLNINFSKRSWLGWLSSMMDTTWQTPLFLISTVRRELSVRSGGLDFIDTDDTSHYKCAYTGKRTVLNLPIIWMSFFR